MAKTPTKKSRLKILVEIKKAGDKGISKRDLSKKTKIKGWFMQFLTFWVLALTLHTAEYGAPSRLALKKP